MKKTAVLLALLMLASSLAGCSDNAAETETQAADTVAVETEPAETEIPDDLPDMDYGGADYRIYTRECCASHSDGVYMPEQTGDVVSDAVYNRNLTVEERFNVKIAEPILAPDAEATDLNNAVQAGDDMCEVAVWHYKHLGDSAAAGYLADISTAGYIGFEKPWWYQKVNDAYSIGGRAYVIVGMYDLDNYYDNVCVYFNKDLLVDLTGDDDLYSVVKEGAWTIDKMNELASLARADLDGDGTMDFGKDQFGYGQACGYGFIYQFAWEQPVTTRDSDGYPVDAINTERMVTIVDTLKSFYFDNDYIIMDESGGPASTAFKEGRELFQLDNLKASSTGYRDMEQDFGILPVTKLDETQQEYYTHATAHTSAVGIPVVKDKAGLEYASLILEAMAAEGYKQIRPAVYDVALKSKYTRDEASFEMIDIVVQGRTADFAEIYDKWGFTYTLDYIARGNVTDWASYYASQNKTQTKNISEVVELFKALEAGE
ncbi:MAG: hypothetical protein IJ480_02225 [Clostridia bacterium]|nr:hypothetical protein [Clostridia bacterium]